jgi:nucleotide-binding universal stress UspA family protein
MYDTILVPTDGSDHSVRAAEHARYLSGLFDAEVHVVSAMDVQGSGGLFDAGGVSEEFVDRMRAECERAIASVTEEVDDVTTEVLRGDPADAILEYAEDAGVDVVAMGTHGRRGLNRYLMGSVTERVVRLSEVPVLTVREVEESRTDGDYGAVLVPTDGSEASEAAVDHALAVAERAGATVHVVNVVDLGEMAASSNYTLPTTLLDHLQEAGEAATERVADRARDRGLEAVTAVLEGTPVADLLGYADDHDVDLIAMGTHGRSGLDRYLMGSTTERVLRRADVPVLTVTPDDLPDQ